MQFAKIGTSHFTGKIVILKYIPIYLQYTFNHIIHETSH